MNEHKTVRELKAEKTLLEQKRLDEKDTQEGEKDAIDQNK